MKKQIEIKIHPDGRIETVTRNMKGKTCLKYVSPLETLLEAKVVDSEFTSEYYEQEVHEDNSQNLDINLRR